MIKQYYLLRFERKVIKKSYIKKSARNMLNYNKKNREIPCK